MAEGATKKSVAIDDLKVVIDDIYSRLNRMATKKHLIKTLNMIRKGYSDIENDLLDKANACDVYSKYEADTEFVTISGLASNIPSAVHKKRVTLEFSKWDDSTGQQSIEDENIKEDSVILISLPLNTTDDAAYEFSSAGITACEQVEGKITLKYTGEKPKRNFLIDLCIM